MIQSILTKLAAVVIGFFCIVVAGLTSETLGSVSDAAAAVPYLAAFGIANVVCSGFLGGFTGRFGQYGVVDKPAPAWIFVLLGWIFLVPALWITIWILLQPKFR